MRKYEKCEIVLIGNEQPWIPGTGDRSWRSVIGCVSWKIKPSH